MADHNPSVQGTMTVRQAVEINDRIIVKKIVSGDYTEAEKMLLDLEQSVKVLEVNDPSVAATTAAVSNSYIFRHVITTWHASIKKFGKTSNAAARLNERLKILSSKSLKSPMNSKKYLDASN